MNEPQGTARRLVESLLQYCDIDSPDLEKEDKASVGDTVRSVSSTVDRLEPDSVGTVLDHAVLSKLAYKGVGRSEQKFPVPAGFECASPDDLPAALRPCYDSQTGLLEMPSKGAKALVVKNADTVVVAFAGTQPKGPVNIP